MANFSSELLRKDISKMSLGFIEGLDGISEDMLVKHLMEKGNNFNKTRALLSIKAFRLEIERDYWTLVFDSIKNHEETGVKMYILGRPGVQTIFIRFACVIGDDPALHRFCGIKESNAMRSCIRCLYSARKDGIYCEATTKLRQYEDLEYYTIKAEIFNRKKLNGERLSERETTILKKLQNQSVQAMKIGCNGVPMGFIDFNIKNNVYISSPNDILHGFLAGIIRNVIIWTMNIVHNLVRISGRDHTYIKYANSRGTLDNRVASFKYLPKMPNMVNAYFRKGCSFINKGKKKKDLKRSTAGVPGLRSLEFITLLLQMYLSVSYINILNFINIYLTIFFSLLDWIQW